MCDACTHPEEEREKYSHLIISFVVLFSVIERDSGGRKKIGILAIYLSWFCYYLRESAGRTKETH